jgi:riboflavin transporter FmnP
MKRAILAFVVSLVIYTVSNFVIHAVLLQPLYQQTPQLLRAPQDGAAHMPFLLLSFVIFTVPFVWIYGRGVEPKGWLGQGLRYGMAIWLIATVARYLTYFAIQPWSATVVAAQVGLELIATLLLSLVLAAIYRKPA